MRPNVLILKKASAIVLFASITSLFAFTAQVQTPAGSAISGVAVTFSGMDTTVYSDANGNVTLTIASAARVGDKVSLPASLRLANKRISLYLPTSENVDMRLYTLSGRQLFARSGLLENGPHIMSLPPMAQGIYVLKAVVGNKSLVRKISSYSVCQWSDGQQNIAGKSWLGKKAMVTDTAVFTKASYGTVRRMFASYGDDLGNVFMDGVNPVLVKAVSANWYNTIILKQDGTLWAVGNNDYGQLGDGTYIKKTIPVQVMSSVSAVSAGNSHTMIIKQDGTLWATGDNRYGQLGDGTTSRKLTPKQVMSGVSAVSAGGHTMIIKQDGTLWATGPNNFGQLGLGDTLYRMTPVQVMSGVASVSAGNSHTMIIKQDGTLWATGDNSCGQLGDGTTISKSIPIQVMNGVSTVSAGYGYTMVVKQDGTLWAMGVNGYGQFGDGTISVKTTPAKVLTGVSAVAAGWYHTLILKQDFTLWTTGDNEFGQLGDGTKNNKSTPIQVMSGITGVAASLDQSMMIKQDGTLWAAGGNSYNDLGDGSGISRTTPFQVMPLQYFGLTVSGGTSSGNYLEGTKLTIVAYDSTTAHRGFDHWGGPDSSLVLNSMFSTTTLTMPNRSIMVKAVYGDLHTLTVNGGSGSGSYIPEVNIFISANDSTATKKAFDHWGGPDSALVLNDTLKTTSIAMSNRDAMIKAVFRDFPVLTVDGGIGSGSYMSGTTVAISANDSGLAKKVFDHWGGPDSVLVLNKSASASGFIMPSR
ncbi:MAG: T9SS type A sorting domain-containing protein, partial [Chitinivibrionales bacterium]|nr:T9SS type A sorting domain-containing protein [Chitinivibrionales bacterium]